MAKERCFKTCLVYGRRWEIGHEREVDRFDEKGQPIASQFFRLIDEVESDPSKVVRSRKQKTDDRVEALRGDQMFAIRKALEQLDPELSSDWSVNGQPSLSRVFTLAGVEVQRADVLAAWPEFDRQFARKLKK